MDLDVKSLKKNNIIIAGVTRAGKSTISHRLAREYGYQHISMDSIIAGFEKCFPETGVNTCAGLSSMDTLHFMLIEGRARQLPAVKYLMGTLFCKKYEKRIKYLLT